MQTRLPFLLPTFWAITMTTPEQNAQQIAANTEAIAGINEAMNFLLTEFIRPNLQQHQQSIERMDRHAEGMTILEQRIDQLIDSLEGVRDIVAQTSRQLAETAQQQQANAQQIAQNAEAITRYDSRLEETRQLVAQNASNIAQGSARHDQEMAEIRAAQDRNDQQIERISTEVQAIAEASRTQLAAIIGNGRRIDRLEQQAS